jgi:hypothetical protein
MLLMDYIYEKHEGSQKAFAVSQGIAPAQATEAGHLATLLAPNHTTAAH